MAMLQSESRRMYSWWWDSHISPKNSKWLQENLTDMDKNVKAMIKLIEEDADSFARRAEMYYKKRPELMKLVEEFYRAYRALAERYDHATGALRQAHRTMAEAFPNQIPPVLPDDSPSSFGSEMGPHTPEMPSPMRALVDGDDLQKDALGVSSHFNVRRRNGVYSEESDSSSKKGLKQLKDLFPSGEGLSLAKFSEGKVRKVLNFKEEEGRVEEKDKLKIEISRLQAEVSQLSTRNETLVSQMASESHHVQSLADTILKLESMKQDALVRYNNSIEKISCLETDVTNTRQELNMVNDKMMLKLNSIEEQCLALEKVNKSLQVELENQKSELEQKSRELGELNTSMEVEHQKRMQAEVALVSLEQIHTHSQEEAEHLVLEIQHGTEKLKNMELNKVGLEEEIGELKDIISRIHEQNVSFDLQIKDLKDEMQLLKETKGKLEYETQFYIEENKSLQEELGCLKESQKDLEQRHQGLTDQMEVVSEKNVLLENSLSDANVELEVLREKAYALEASCGTLLGEVSTHVVEKGVLASQAEISSQKLERLAEKNTLQENSLSDANAELESLRVRFKELEECCTSFCNQNSTLLTEKNNLISQKDNFESKYLELQSQHANLEKDNYSTVRQVMDLQSCLAVEKQEHESLISSLSTQLASLRNQVHLLEEQLQIKADDFDMEQQNVMSSLLEIFILQRCLYEMNDKNLFLFGECQNLQQVSRSVEYQISQLKCIELSQKKEINSLLEYNEVLNNDISSLLEALSIDMKHRSSSNIKVEVPLQIILGEIESLQTSIWDAQAVKKQLCLEMLNLENKYVALQDEHINLEREKNSLVNQVTVLESSLSLNQQEYEHLTLSFSSQLASLQNQIHLLLEENRITDEEFKLEHQKTIEANLEIFILQRCLYDMQDKNVILSGDSHNLLQSLKCAEERISQLEHDNLVQKKELTLLSDKSEIIRNRSQVLLKTLNIDLKNGAIDDYTDEVISQTILGEISNLKSSVSYANDENQCLNLDVLVLGTILRQHGLDKYHLHHEYESQKMELLSLAIERNDLMQMNKQLNDGKKILISQVEIFRKSLETLQTQYLELEDKNLYLESEKDLAFHQIEALKSSLKLEKQEHHALTMSSKSHLASLETQLDILQEEMQVKADAFETEQQKTMHALLEIFILHRCLCDMMDKNSILLIQQKEKMAVSESNKRLRSGIVLLLKEIDISKEWETVEGIDDEVLLQTLLFEFKMMLESVSNVQEENQCLHLEISVLVTLLRQITLEKVHIHNELASRHEELLSMQMKKTEALEINKQLQAEIQFLSKQLLGLHLSKQKAEAEICKLLDSVSSTQEERQRLLLEISVLVTLLTQIGQEKIHINNELTSRTEELLVVQTKNTVAMKMNEQLKTEMLFLKNQILDFHASHQRSESITCKLLNSVSRAEEERQCLNIEISVFATMLEQISVDKVHLYHDIASRDEKLLSERKKKDEAMKLNEKLKAEMQILCEQLSNLHISHQRLEAEICNLLDENHFLTKRTFDLKEKLDTVEGVNDDILAEALTLDQLFVYFKTQGAERGSKLKLLSDDICGVLSKVNGLDEEVRLQNERIRELEVQTMNLKESSILQEFDLNTSRGLCEQFNLQIKAAEDLLMQKEMDLSDVREENEELHRKLEGINMSLESVNTMRRELEKETGFLVSCIASKDEEITDVLGANKLLCMERDRLKSDVEVLKRREECLSSELNKGTCELYKCEGEIQTLLDDIQISTFHAAILEEKLLDLLVAYEGIEMSSILRSEMLGEEIASKSACINELKKKLDCLGGENTTLKAELNAYSALLMSLLDGVSCLEEYIFSLAKLQERQDGDGPLNTPQNERSNHQSNDNERTTANAGISDLQKLIVKIEVLKKVIIDTKNLLEQERLDSNAIIGAARKEIEELKLKEILLQEISKEKYAQTMKDIQLDQVSSSCTKPYRVNRNEKAESDDQMLELWETAEIDDTEAVEEVKSEYPSSELIAQKEPSIDKLEVSARVNESSPLEWNRRSIQMLDSDAQRLSVLQKSLQELKTKVESSEKKKRSKTSEYGSLKLQLREAEKATLEQTDINNNLKKKVEDNFESSNAVIWEKERKVSEQARKASENIGKLELEIQKIEYIFLKVEDEEEKRRTGCGDRASSILLGEYIYGKGDGKGKRKNAFCRCMRPKTKA